MTAHRDWSDLEHAYGTAEDTPGFIEALRGADWESALQNLHASILHQGTIYNATLPAVPRIVDVALDAAAPGRQGALWFIVAYAESIAQGYSESSHYLPEDTDMDDFDESARAALSDASRRLAPLLDDADDEVRASIYQLTSYLVDEPVAEEIMPLVRAKFDNERAAAASLIESLVRHDLFTEADFEVVLERGDDAVTFAAAWSAIAEGMDLPDAIDHVVRLWLAQADGYPGSGASLEVLANHAGPRAVPVLQALADSIETDALADAWVEVGLASRSSVDAVLDGLLALAPRTVGVVTALAQVLPAVPERAAELCDAVFELADSDDPTLRAVVATTLFSARDPRWAAPAKTVTAHPTEPTVARRKARMSFAYALTGFGPQRPDLLWAADDLFELAVAALGSWRSGAWVEVLGVLPLTQETVRAVVPFAAELPAQVGKLLAHAVVAGLAVPPLDGTDAWVITAGALADPDADLDTAFRRAWESNGGDDRASSDLIDVWSTRPSPALRETCLRLLDGTALTSFPGQFAQLAAARAVDDPARTWPTVRAVLDEAGNPLPTAIAAALALDEHRAEVVALLEDISTTGRETWSGRDHLAVVVAVDTLVDLGEIAPGAAVERVIEALFDSIDEHSACRVAPQVGLVLGKVLAAHPELREQVREQLSDILDDDHRLPTASDTIAEDVEITTALRAGLGG
ncbi:hypothetical protein [Actinokineospora terrae]|uniref:HEAT repeat-containing protein n=1 Tax=Actinokineospora terrae TaxID=155974 RepID=A0A1H9X9C4_9PSEU|nr:hypothetical protein [Actinokineospora terrae]SES42750.1 hypothetical protein SAMN04487818_113184 [Actinokineospora terrae]